MKYSKIRIINLTNSNIVIDCCHYRYEELVQGCKRVAEQYRFTNAPNNDRFQVEVNGEILLLDGKPVVV